MSKQDPNGIDYQRKDTTPTGVPITLCPACNRTHPAGRAHCTQCGRASLFLAHGKCHNCQRHNSQED